MLKRLIAVFNSRKFLVFLYTMVSSSYLLVLRCGEKQCLPPEQYSDVVIWMCLLFFGANVLARVDQDKKELPNIKLSHKVASQKFLSLCLLFGFLFFALKGGLLPANVYANLIVWVSGGYFGVDVARIYAYRQGKLGAPEYARDEYNFGLGGQQPPYQPGVPPYTPPGYGPPTDVYAPPVQDPNAAYKEQPPSN